MRVAVVNRFYPPDAAITGVSAAELVVALVELLPHVEFRVFASGARYAGGIQSGDFEAVTVDRVGSLQLPGGKLSRLASSLAEGRALARRAVAWADVVISLTDPPLLGYWIGREIARQDRRIRWLEWTMDLYPEAFCAASLVGQQNFVYRHLLSSVRRHLPDAYLCLGPTQAAAVATWRMADKPAFVLPCGIIEGLKLRDSEPPAWRIGEGRTILAYAGNLGEAHCPSFLQRLVEAANPEHFLFVFALYGAHSAETKARLAQRRNVVWADRLSHADLAHADVHIASLGAEWTHVCVPSKAVSTICLGRPLLFAGSSETDTAQMLGEASWIVPVSIDGHYGKSELTTVLAELKDPEKRMERGANALLLARQLAVAKALTCQQIADYLSRIFATKELRHAA